MIASQTTGAASVCPSCGVDTPRLSRFCAACGNRIAPAAPAAPTVVQEKYSTRVAIVSKKTAIVLGATLVVVAGAAATYWWLRDPVFESRVVGTASECIRPCIVTFSHDGAMAAYVASEGRRQRVVLTAGTSSVPFDQVANLVFSDVSDV